MSRLTIEPLDAPLGARVHGLSFADAVDGERRAELQHALDEHLVLVFENGDAIPTDQQLVDFCSAFGELRPTLADRSRLPAHPAINLVSNRDIDGVVGTGGHGVVTWHSDLHFTPPLLETLFLDALHVTSHGGETKWTNLCAAYDALDPEVALRIDTLAVRYRFRDGVDLSGYFKTSTPLNTATSADVSLVHVNPRTGRKAVWPNTGPDFVSEVVGLAPEESETLLTDLYAHCTQDQFVYTHRWKVGDACMWLNTQTMHQREAFSDDETRVLRHLNILGVTDPHQQRAAAVG